MFGAVSLTNFPPVGTWAAASRERQVHTVTCWDYARRVHRNVHISVFPQAVFLYNFACPGQYCPCILTHNLAISDQNLKVLSVFPSMLQKH